MEIKFHHLKSSNSNSLFAWNGNDSDDNIFKMQAVRLKMARATKSFFNVVSTTIHNLLEFLRFSFDSGEIS